MAITKEEAIKEALKISNYVDSCIEYKDAFLFTTKGGGIQFGGANSPFALLKDGGQLIPYTTFILKYKNGGQIGSAVPVRATQKKSQSSRKVAPKKTIKK